MWWNNIFNWIARLQCWIINKKWWCKFIRSCSPMLHIWIVLQFFLGRGSKLSQSFEPQPTAHLMKTTREISKTNQVFLFNDQDSFISVPLGALRISFRGPLGWPLLSLSSIALSPFFLFEEGESPMLRKKVKVIQVN